MKEEEEEEVVVVVVIVGRILEDLEVDCSLAPDAFPS